MALKKEYWAERWEDGQIKWQRNDVHPKLLQHLGELISGDSSLKFFVPLCGKTKDIPYLLSKGHTVFGIEYVAQAVEELDSENSLGLQFNEESSIYQTEDKKLTIFRGDFKDCPIEKYGPFDVIWDKASLIAIDYSVRSQYAELMKRSVLGDSPNDRKFWYLLQSLEYDKSIYDGPPKCVTEEDINTMFGSWAKVKLLEKKTLPEDDPARTITGKLTGEAFESYHLMQNK